MTEKWRTVSLCVTIPVIGRLGTTALRDIVKEGINQRLAMAVDIAPSMVGTARVKNMSRVMAAQKIKDKKAADSERELEAIRRAAREIARDYQQ